MFSSQALHEQLSAIMSTLSQAALSQMCAAVDQGFAAWQREISRKQQENQELRRKLHLIESIVLKGKSGGEQPQEEHDDPNVGSEQLQVEIVEEPKSPEVVEIKDEDTTDALVLIKDEDTTEASGDERPCADSRGPHMSSVEESASMRSPSSESGSSSTTHRSLTTFRMESRHTEPERFSSVMDLDVQPSPCGGFFPSPSVLGTQTSGQNEQEPWTSTYNDSDGLGLKLVSVSGSTSSLSQQPVAFEFSSFKLLSGSNAMDQLNVGAQTSKPKRFPCSICQKNFTTAQSLEVHTRIHTGERPFRCEQCGKRFTQSSHLKSHYHSIHKPTQTHTCPVCSHNFSSVSTLKAHVNKWHP